MKLAVCPGSFDPVTNGHMDIIERASRIFDRCVVVVMQNRHKNGWFSWEQRLEMLKSATAHLPNVVLDSSDLLLAEYCKTLGDAVIVRGLRAVSDFEHEFQMALINRRMNPDLDTMFLTASENNQYLSSSVVKEICAYGGDVSAFVPGAVYEKLRTRRFD